MRALILVICAAIWGQLATQQALAYTEKFGNVSGQNWPAGTYWISADIYVNDGNTLTLQPGAVLKFYDGTMLTVYGTLNAVGEEGSRIVFTSEDDDAWGETLPYPISDGDPDPGDWDGVLAYGQGSYDGVAYLEWCRLRYGGNETGTVDANLKFHTSNSGYFTNCTSSYSSDVGVRLYACWPTLTSSTFRYNLSHGLLVQVNGTTVTGCHFEDNDGYAAWLDNVSLGSFTGNTGSGNDINGFCLSGTVNAARTWTHAQSDFPYVLVGNVTVNDGQTLTLNPGTIIKSDSGYQLLIYGSLDANGLPGDEVVFTSLKDDAYGGDTNMDDSATQPAPGDWVGVYCYGSGAYDGIGEFDNCILRYGGAGTQEANLYYCVSNSGHFTNSLSELSLVNGVRSVSCSPSINSSTMSDNLGCGLRSETSGGPSVLDNVFNDNGDYAVKLTDQTLVSYSGNTGNGNGVNGFGLKGTVNAARTWTQAQSDFPYVLVGSVTVNDGQTLTLDPGTLVKSDSGYQLLVYGSLDANGLPGDEVVFTSLKDDAYGGDTNMDDSATQPAPGDWVGVRCYGSGANDGIGEFDNCILRYGGGGASTTNLYFNQSNSGSFSNGTSEQSAGTGISVNYCSPVIGHSHIRNNTSYGVYVSNSSPVLGACDGSSGGYNYITGNDSGGYQVYNDGANNIDACYNAWGYASDPEIDAHIYDDDEDPAKGVVNFANWFVIAVPVITDITVLTDLVTLEWTEVINATSYRVYSSVDPYDGFTLDESGVFIGTQWTAPQPEANTFYYITAVIE